MLDVSLLGTGGMMPLPNRFLTSFITRLNGKFLLIDSGEGTQVTLKLLGWGFKNIDIICFTHFHADHISGLPGLLLTIGNAGRTEPLNLVGPKGLTEVVNSLRIIAPELPFNIIYNELPFIKEKEINLTINDYNINAFPLDHGTTCFAYNIEVKRSGKFDLEKAKALNLPVNLWGKLQKGEQVTYNGCLYTEEMILGPKRKSIKVSYCTDTRPTKGITNFIKNSDLFICEGLYGEDENLEKAIKHRHMLFSEAATIAKDGNVNELWLTHFSPALTQPENFLPLARNIFPNTYVGFDRKTKTLYFED